MRVPSASLINSLSRSWGPNDCGAQLRLLGGPARLPSYTIHHTHTRTIRDQLSLSLTLGGEKHISHLQLSDARFIPPPRTVFGLLRKGTLDWKVLDIVVIVVILQPTPVEKYPKFTSHLELSNFQRFSLGACTHVYKTSIVCELCTHDSLASFATTPSSLSMEPPWPCLLV